MPWRDGRGGDDERPAKRGQRRFGRASLGSARCQLHAEWHPPPGRGQRQRGQLPRQEREKPAFEAATRASVPRAPARPLPERARRHGGERRGSWKCTESRYGTAARGGRGNVCTTTMAVGHASSVECPVCAFSKSPEARHVQLLHRGGPGRPTARSRATGRRGSASIRLQPPGVDDPRQRREPEYKEGMPFGMPLSVR